MQILSHEVHVWTSDLAITSEQEQEKLTILSADELERAQRFFFPIHKKRFIASRSMLRVLLGLYLNRLPENVCLGYTDKKKPYIAAANTIDLQFNLSHSHDIAIYAFTLKHEIGVDIEKIQTHYNADIMQRFFSEQENQDLQALSLVERTEKFYKIWAYKEALVKAKGKGLSMPLASFSTCLHKNNQLLIIDDQTWTLISLAIDSAYQAALATNQAIDKIYFWKYFDHLPVLEQVYKF